MSAELDRLDRLAAETIICIHDKVTAGAALQEFYDHWQPTRNISQAWQCLEKFDEIGWNVSFGYSGYKAVIMTDNWIEESAETAPRAIVKACLKARGVTVSPVDEEKECSHTWKIWGDDPKVRCYYCGIYRRQANGELL